VAGELFMEKVILAIDIGGSKYMLGLVSEDGEVYAAKRYLWTALTADEIMKDIKRASHAFLEDYPCYSPDAIGVTIPGLADPKHGLWIEASFSGIRNIEIGTKLYEEFAIPVYIDNDGQACALAEKLYGACKDVNDFLYITVSNGCGGAVFADGKLYYGASGNAGEIGHCMVAENGRPCKCGNKGCLEVYAAGPAIVNNFIELGGPNVIGGVPVDAKSIAALAKEGDVIACETFRLEGYYIGKVIAAACNLLNPQRVIIGGGVSLAFPLYEQSLRDTVNRFLYTKANNKLQIQPTDLGYNGGLLGATAVAVSGLYGRYQG
jgi:glucokinase